MSYSIFQAHACANPPSKSQPASGVDTYEDTYKDTYKDTYRDAHAQICPQIHYPPPVWTHIRTHIRTHTRTRVCVCVCVCIREKGVVGADPLMDPERGVLFPDVLRALPQKPAPQSYSDLA